MLRRPYALAAVLLVLAVPVVAAVAAAGRATTPTTALTREAEPATTAPASTTATVAAAAPATTTATTAAPATTLASPAPAPAAVATPAAVALDPARPAEPERRIEIRLACGPADGGIGCEWSQVEHPRAAGYRLWRAVDVPDPEHHRQVIFRTGDLGHTRFLDAEVRPGHTFHYAVEVVGAGGTSLAWSAPVRVELPPEQPQDLGLRCEGVRRTEEHRAGIACGWTASTHRAFAGYRLVRSDGDQRTVVFRTDDRAATRHLDVEVRPGATYIYAVEAITADGRVVGFGGPVRAPAPEPPEPPLTERPVVEPLPERPA